MAFTKKSERSQRRMSCAFRWEGGKQKSEIFAELIHLKGSEKWEIN